MKFLRSLIPVGLLLVQSIIITITINTTTTHPNFNLIGGVYGHAYMSSPPARNVIQSIPEHKTYDKQSLACGGPALEYDAPMSYKHGMCGNKYTDSVQNWNIPGKAGTHYTNNNNLINGSIIPVSVIVTAHHLGYFKFDLCNSPAISELCFAKYRLKRVGCTHGDCTKFWKPLVPGELSSFSLASLHSKKALIVSLPSQSTIVDITYTMEIQLPHHLQCANCVLRWNYYSTNSCVKNKVLDVSEEFWNCADISINSYKNNISLFNNTEKYRYLSNDQPINKALNKYSKHHMAQYCPIIPAPPSTKHYTYVTTPLNQAMRYEIIK